MISSRQRNLTLPEILFSSSDPSQSRSLSRMIKEGVIRKIAPKVYSSNLLDAPEKIILRNIYPIIGRLYPGSVLSFRSALETKLSPNKNLYLTYRYKNNVELPGVTLRFSKGPGPVEDDMPLNGGLYLAQEARALLENLSVSRTQKDENKILPKQELEKILDSIIQVQGEEAINKIRDKARDLAVQLSYTTEFKKLDTLIGAMLSTRPSTKLVSPIAKARAAGLPYDAHRLELFNTLFSDLRSDIFPLRPDPNTAPKAFADIAFFESYFSNYIEGTKFKLEDAKSIILSGKIMPHRSADSHDILGTYQIVANRSEMNKVPTTPEEFIALMQSRHRIVLRARREMNPGELKLRNNMAGDVVFVDFKLVRGTLNQSFPLYKALSNPFSKAVFMLFIVSEIHPFDDGNGRLARIMMNAELVRSGQARIIIPTVFREDYFGTLRKLTRQSKTDPFIRAMQRAHEFSAMISGKDLDQIAMLLTSMNAFLEPVDGNKIKLPSH
jgi:hypothetical protein